MRHLLECLGVQVLPAVNESPWISPEKKKPAILMGSGLYIF
jgi:hypothetical protein